MRRACVRPSVRLSRRSIERYLSATSVLHCDPRDEDLHRLVKTACSLSSVE